MRCTIKRMREREGRGVELPPVPSRELAHFLHQHWPRKNGNTGLHPPTFLREDGGCAFVRWVFLVDSVLMVGSCH